MRVLSTIPPYAPYISEVADHPAISGLRLNTMMPTKGTLEDLLISLRAKAGKQPVWLDLKCRQMRIDYGFFFKEPETPRTYVIDGVTYVLDASNPRAVGVLRSTPWAEIKLTHKIKLDTSKGPVKCYLQDGYDSAHIAEVVNGDTLIMLDGPKRICGGGESINILDPSLEIEGFFTATDLAYIEAAKKVGVHNYMLSYVEQDSDIEDMLARDPEANVIAKIESLKGLDWVKNSYAKYAKRVRLMAARGDLFVEVGATRPEKIMRALKTIIRADPKAVVASRLLTSLRTQTRPTCSDITDVGYLMALGYRNFMIGDDICFDRGQLLLGLDIMRAIGAEA